MLTIPQLITTAITVTMSNESLIHAEKFNLLIDQCTDIQAELNEYFADGDEVSTILSKVVVDQYVEAILVKLVEESFRLFPNRLVAAEAFRDFIYSATYTVLHELWTPASKCAHVLQAFKLAMITEHRTESVGESIFSVVPGLSQIRGSSRGWVAKGSHNLYIDQPEIATTKSYSRYRNIKNNLYDLIKEPAFYVNLINIPIVIPTYHQIDLAVSRDELDMRHSFDTVKSEVLDFIQNSRDNHFTLEEHKFKLETSPEGTVEDLEITEVLGGPTTKSIKEFFSQMLEVYKGF